MEAVIGAGMKSNGQLLGQQGKWRCGDTVWQSWKWIGVVAHLHPPGSCISVISMNMASDIKSIKRKVNQRGRL